MKEKIVQDLHIHSTYSTGDTAVAPQQTLELIAALEHAEVRGISDHFEYLTEASVFEEYRRKAHNLGFYCGCEVNDSSDAEKALDYPYDYYIYHCRNQASEYKGAERLLEAGKPIIISHPMAMGADLNKVPTDCFIEVNNRYVWQREYKNYYSPHLNRFRFLCGSDAHKPNWLNHLVASYAMEEMGLENTLIFKKRYSH